MSSLASLADLETYLNTSFAGGAATQAQALLDAATAEIVDHIGHEIVSPVGSRTATLDPAGRFMLRLPTMPVTAVDSVTNDGTVLVVATDVIWYPDGRIYRADGLQWGTKRQSVVVGFHAGFSAIPQDLIDVCRQRAARRLENPTGDKAESAGNYRADYPEDAFTDAELDILRGYRGVTVG